MNRYETLKQKFTDCAPVCGTTYANIIDPIILSKMDHPDLDFILFDAEHGRYDAQNVYPMVHMCRMMGLPSIVRIQDAWYHLAAKPLDMGADGIMVPRTETLEQIKKVIDGLCFYPVGRKGNGGPGQLMPGETIEQFNRSRFLMLQIESPKGIENLPAMLETYGEHISAIIIGPYDLSVMVGTPMDIYSEKMDEAIKKVFAISKTYKKSCGIFCNDASDAARFREMGANVYWTGLDIQFLLSGFHQTFDDLAKLK